MTNNASKRKESAPVPDTTKSSVSQVKTTVPTKTEGSALDAADGIPDEDALQDNTLDADPNPADVGEFTEQLSDVSDGEDDQAQRTASRNALSTWYRVGFRLLTMSLCHACFYQRIQPLIRNKRVRVFAIINTFLTAINLILFIGCIIILGFVVFEVVSVNNRSNVDKPCIYQWTEWSECSATCKAINDSTPVKTRKVKADTIIHTRGEKYKPCEDDLENKEDIAPCNTHTCPQKLSSFNYIKKPFKFDPAQNDNKCYIIRDVPIGDHLIEIDVADLYKECTCGSDCNNKLK